MPTRVQPRTPTAEERHDLKRAFAVWTGRDDLADELAQETIVAAWRSNRQPDNPDEWRPWLFGVARNVLLRYRREAAIHSSRVIAEAEHPGLLEVAAAADDIEALLTRSELVAVLDALLGRLPAETRDALVLKYAEGLSQAAIANRLVMNEKALEGRLHRGKGALKQAMLTDRPDLAIAMGLVSEPAVWQTLPERCPFCGTAHLTGRWFDDGGLRVICPECGDGDIGFGFESVAVRPAMRTAVPRVSMSRAFAEMLPVGAPVVRAGIHATGTCAECGATVQPRLDRPYEHNPDAFRLLCRCERCGVDGSSFSISGLGLVLPAGLRFWQTHRSIHALPTQLLDWHGAKALETAWESNDGDRFTTWHDLTTGALLDVAVNCVTVDANDLS